MAHTTQRRHMATYENVTCHTRVHVPVCARVCMNHEITYFSGFLLSHYVHMPYIRAHSL